LSPVGKPPLLSIGGDIISHSFNNVSLKSGKSLLLVIFSGEVKPSEIVGIKILLVFEVSLEPS
jgi:hypothetical protein